MNEMTLEVTYSRKKGFRSIITRDADKRFRVRREKWCAKDAEHTRRGHWLEDGRSRTIAASLEAARILAQEKLSKTLEGLDP
jgi:hypothetical protein